jgi:hypothetical protein
MNGDESSGFTKHSKGNYGAAALQKPTFTVYENGSARFNKAAADQYLPNVETVTYYTDIETGRLGISLGGTDSDAYTLTHQDNGGAECHLRSVLTEFGVRVDGLDESHTLDLERDPDAGLLVIDLTPVLEDGGVQ